MATPMAEVAAAPSTSVWRAPSTAFLAELSERRAKKYESEIRSKVLCERLRLERRLHYLCCPWCNFLTILVLFFTNLLLERPFSEMYEIKSNIKDHFQLPDVAKINTYDAMYEFMYAFLETAERFDPLDRSRYASRAYGNPGNTTLDFTDFGNDIHDVTLQRVKKFYGVSAVVVRPMVMMTRGRREECKGYATHFDTHYSMARYLRYKYRGSSMEGGWQPTRVWFKTSDKDESPMEMSMREPTAKSYLSKLTSNINANKGSKLLMCIRPELNSTFRHSLKNKYLNVAITRNEKPYFGDLLTAPDDILAYMGYSVYPHTVNFTSHPDCFLTSKRDAATGEVLPNGEKVTIRDVADRCAKTGARWHDVHTRTVQVQIFLYTPVIEIFTRIKVDFFLGQSGLFQNTYEVASFQDLKKTQRYHFWLVLTIVQTILCIAQLCIVGNHYRSALKHDAEEPTAPMLHKSEFLRLVFSVSLQSSFIGYHVYRFILVHFGDDVWEVLESLLSTNPYHEPGGMAAAEKQLDKLTSFAEEYRFVRIYGFALVIFSFIQNVAYMSAHPQTGLMSSMVLSIISEIFHFMIIFGIVYLMLCLVGAWAFGADLGSFHSPGESFVKGFRWAIFGGADALHDVSGFDIMDTFLLSTWEILYTIVCFVFLLNAFLAIVVQGYDSAQEAANDNEAENNFLIDICLVPWARLNRSYFGWPAPTKVLAAVLKIVGENDSVTVSSEEEEEKELNLSPADLVKAGLFADEPSAKKYINFYCSVIPRAAHVSEFGAHIVGEKETAMGNCEVQSERLSVRRSSIVSSVSSARDETLPSETQALIRFYEAEIQVTAAKVAALRAGVPIGRLTLAFKSESLAFDGQTRRAQVPELPTDIAQSQWSKYRAPEVPLHLARREYTNNTFSPYYGTPRTEVAPMEVAPSQWEV